MMLAIRTTLTATTTIVTMTTEAGVHDRLRCGVDTGMNEVNDRCIMIPWAEQGNENCTGGRDY